MKKTFATIFTILAVLVFVIFVFNQNKIIESPTFADELTVYLEINEKQSVAPYLWENDEYIFVLTEAPEGEYLVDLKGTYNGYDVKCEGYIVSDNDGVTLKYVYVPETVYVERCIRYDLNKIFKVDGFILTTWESDKYVYNLNDTWTHESGVFKYKRSRDMENKSNVYLGIDIDENDYYATVKFVDVPVSFENILNSLSSTVNYLNENKPVFPDESENDNILDEFKSFFRWLKVVAVDYPAHYFKYIVYFLEDFNIIWNY